MAHGWSRFAAGLVGMSLMLCACSSSARHPASQPQTTTGAVSTSSSASAVQAYLDTVNKLCDALLPKVIAVTHGGSLDIPVKAYLAQQPAHAKLLADFDRELANVPVPPAAQDKAGALMAYIVFANKLDARRLAAAKKGAAAYAKEIKSEASAENDPSIAARNAAGFNQSCDAR